MPITAGCNEINTDQMLKATDAKAIFEVAILEKIIKQYW